MAEIRNFHDFESFKACRAFVRAIGLTLRKPKFSSDRILAAQMQRASISVLSNFAEGFEREGNTEFIQFLSVSKGSVGELRAQLIYSLDLACIAHKSLEICERCRLWQQNSPATPENSAAFCRGELKTVCFDSFILKQALKQTRSVCLRAF